MIDRLKSYLNFRGLSGKIVMASALPVMVMTIGLIYILVSVKVLSTQINNVLNNTVPAISSSKDLTIELRNIEKEIWALSLYKDNKDETENHIFELEDAITRLDTGLEVMQKLHMPELATKLQQSSVDKWKGFKGKLVSFKEQIAEGKVAEISQTYLNDIRPELKEVGDIFVNVELNNVNIIEKEKEVATATSEKLTVKMIIIFTLLVILFSILVSLFISSKISSTILKLTADLNNQSGKTLDEAVKMEESSTFLSDKASESSDSINRTSSAMHQIKTMVEKNDSGASKTSEVSKQNVMAIEEGKKSIDNISNFFSELNVSMNSMIDVIESNNKQIEEISNIINSISDKTAVINDIVMQTKLLSFNASVEAARAGESGKGFAVVAEEVGNLALSSGNAAKEIVDLISISRDNVNQIVTQAKSRITQVINQTESNIQKGKQYVELSLETFDQLLAKTEAVDQLIKEIETSSKEQLRAISDINSTISQLSTISEETSQSGLKLVESAKSVSEKSGTMSHTTAQIVEVISGSVPRDL